MATLKEIDIAEGKKALQSYFIQMKNLYPKSYGSLSYESFYPMLTKVRGAKFLDEGIGGMIRETGLNSIKVNEAMKKIATSGGGKVPASLNDYVNGLQGQASKINYIDMAVTVGLDTVKDIGSGFQQVGNSLLTTGKIINFLLPALVIGGLLLYANEKSGGGLVKNLKAFKGLK